MKLAKEFEMRNNLKIETKTAPAPRRGLLKLMGAAAALILALAQTGCFSSDPFYIMTEQYSVNIVKPNLNSKNIPLLTPAQKKIYDQFGPPDYMRLLWTPDGDLAHRIKERYHLKDIFLNALERTWIYMDRNGGIEVRFKGADINIQRLTDLIRTVCEQGDPSNVIERNENRDHPAKELEYFSKGVRFRFDESGALVNKSFFDKMRW
ncbi:MAG: hypothetical protein NTX50_32035 [Candidatus Sumerlaeota bacterium]|nr:hypothetical protein [Candidatus Sumerlaeota bacterium]